MTRILVLCAAGATAALALVGAAPAKEISAVEVCGPDACAGVADRETLTRFEETAGGFEVSTGPAVPAEFYVLRLTYSDGVEQHSWENYYVPSARVLRSVDQFGRAAWRRAPKAQRLLLDPLAAQVQPYPVPVVTKATVGRKRVAAPASYLGLYRLARSPRAYPKHERGWQRVRLASALPSPWTDGANTLRYLRRERLLERDGQYVRLSRRLARAVRRASALRIPG
jgi:hypothetical protein